MGGALCPGQAQSRAWPSRIKRKSGMKVISRSVQGEGGMRCGSGEFTWTAFIVHVTCESAYPEVCLWYKLSSQVIVNII